MMGTRTRSRFVALAVAAVASLGITTFAAPAAQAHDQLVSSSPAADAVLETAPESVELVYTEEIVELGVIIEVVGFDGEDWVEGTPTVASTTVTVPLRPGMFEGAYELRWRVVSSDGHPIDGTSTFTVTHADETPATPPATESATPVAPPSESPVAAPNDTAADAPPMGTTIAVGAVLLLIVVAVALLARYLIRRKDRAPRP